MVCLVPDVPHSTELYPWISAATLAWGLLDCFFGYRIFRMTFMVLGGLAGALFGQAAGMAMGLGAAGEIGGSIVGALGGAALTLLLFLGAVFLAGFAFGGALGGLLLAGFGQMIALPGGCLLGIMGGIAALKLQRLLLTLSTALLGAVRATLALYYFTSQLDWLYYLQHPEQLAALKESRPWILPCILALATVGAVAQFGIVGGGPARTKEKNP